MNGSHFKKISTRLVRQPWLAGSLAVAVLGTTLAGLVGLGSLAWRGFSGQTAVQATRTDASSYDRLSPHWPGYLPASPVSAQVPSIQYPSPVLPAVEAGPELFGPSMRLAPQGKLVAAGAAPHPPAQVPPPMGWYRPAAGVATAPAAPRVRSAALEKISVQSDQLVRHGFELASRGAYFAARGEFIAALRLVAQGLDSDQNTTLHSEALTAALTAMKEAQDFIPPGGKLEGELNLPPIIAAHSTPVFKNLPAEPLQAVRALKEYHNYAQFQLACAAGQEVSASVALGALGKLHATLGARPNPEIVAAEAKAIVFFQAALLACPRNYMAANDLGVLLAHNGDFAGARRMLEHSVLVYRCPENLNNLSVVYRQVSEPRLADLAAEKAQVAQAAEIARQQKASVSADGKVQWVDPGVLAQSASPWDNTPARQAAGSQAPAAAQPVVGQAPPPFAPVTAH